MKKLYLYEVRNLADCFLSCTSLEDLRQLDFDTNQMKLLSLNPPYYSFKIKKEKGGYRRIEAPEEELKVIQKELNEYLQCVYYTMQSKAAYGYIIRTKDAEPYKNILENARQHLGAKYMLNCDFKDFFHQITAKWICKRLKTPPFQFNKKTAQLLTEIMTRNGRLPMGAPTSPVLSNFATLKFDKALSAWAVKRDLTYTRFVDDLTFSSKSKAITALHFEAIQKIAIEHGFLFNAKKTKYYDDWETKKVTGLLLNETIDIDPNFYREIDKNLKRLRHLAEVNIILQNTRKADLLQDFKQEVEGMINFIGMIEGYGSSEYRKYRKRLKKALAPPDEALSVKWTNSNYF